MRHTDQSINQSIWRIFIAPLKIRFHRGADSRCTDVLYLDSVNTF